MDADIIFNRVIDGDLSKIKTEIRLLNVFMVMDGKKSIRTIANEYNYDIDDLISMADKIEKMGLLVPVDGTNIKSRGVTAETSFAKLPPAFLTGIEVIDRQHQQLVGMIAQLDAARKSTYRESVQRREAIARVISEMIDYTISHFAFEEALMKDAQYEVYPAHNRIHRLFVDRAGEYKKRFDAGEDILDELHDVLKRWLFNHIQNDDKAFAPVVTARLKKIGRAKKGFLGGLFKRFFHHGDAPAGG